MNTNEHFEEDDLFLYAMRLLPASEHDAMTKLIAANPRARERLAEMQALLGAFAEATVESVSAPAGSLDRLMSRLGPVTPSVAAAPAPRTSPVIPMRKTQPRQTPGFWAGWAIAALLALSVGAVTFRLAQANKAISALSSEVASTSAEAAQLRQQREEVQARLAEEHARVAQEQTQEAHLSGAAQAAENGANTLASALAGKTEEAREQSARALQAEQEKARLQGTVAQQQAQLTQSATASQDAQTLAALTDPNALRVVLTKPKSKPVPTGRAAYVASKGTLVFLVSHLSAPKPNKVYELWLLPASGANPIPAGTFVPDAAGNASLTYAHFPQSVAAKGFAVTEENAGGAQAPTPPLLLAGF